MNPFGLNEPTVYIMYMFLNRWGKHIRYFGRSSAIESRPILLVLEITRAFPKRQDSKSVICRGYNFDF